MSFHLALMKLCILYPKNQLESFLVHNWGSIKVSFGAFPSVGDGVVMDKLDEDVEWK